MEYIIWNVESTDCKTYSELLVLEREGTQSSIVSTDHIDSVVESIVNEWNGVVGVMQCYSREQSIAKLLEEVREAKYIIEASDNSEATALLATMEILGLCD